MAGKIVNSCSAPPDQATTFFFLMAREEIEQAAESRRMSGQGAEERRGDSQIHREIFSKRK